MIEHGSTNYKSEKMTCQYVYTQPSLSFSCSNTVYSILLIRCILSLSQAFLNNTELKIFGHHRESNPGLLVYRKKACERERIYLMSKRRPRKKL